MKQSIILVLFVVFSDRSLAVSIGHESCCYLLNGTQANNPINEQAAIYGNISRSVVEKNDNSPNSKQSDDINLYKKTFDTIIAYYPDSEMRKALSEYSKLLKIDKYNADADVGYKNLGIISHNEDSLKNSSKCFQTQMYNFYHDMRIEFNENIYCSKKYGDCDNLSHNRPLIIDKAGDATYQSYQPGWLWARVLKYSKNDPNLALKMLNFCGNDDIPLDYKITLMPTSKKYNECLEQKNEAQIILNSVNQSINDLKNDTSGTKFSKLSNLTEYKNQMIEQIREIDKCIDSGGAGEVNLNCSFGNSPFFLSQSLSKEVDIDENEKLKILKLQKKVQAEIVVPSKNYHIYSAAANVCSLIENGVNPDKAVLVEETASRIYRGIRLCSSINRSLEQKRMSIASLQAINGGKPISDEELIRLMKLSIKQKFDKNIKISDQEVNLSKNVFYLYFNSYFSEAELNRTADNVISEWDAASLYSQWYIGAKIPLVGTNIPCTDIKLIGPADMADPLKNWYDRLNKPYYMNDERYTKAAKKLAS